MTTTETPVATVVTGREIVERTLRPFNIQEQLRNIEEFCPIFLPDGKGGFKIVVAFRTNICVGLDTVIDLKARAMRHVRKQFIREQFKFYEKYDFHILRGHALSLLALSEEEFVEKFHFGRLLVDDFSVDGYSYLFDYERSGEFCKESFETSNQPRPVKSSDQLADVVDWPIYVGISVNRGDGFMNRLIAHAEQCIIECNIDERLIGLMESMTTSDLKLNSYSNTIWISGLIELNPA